jgi:DNA-binding MarR family transcriptional regulator
MPNTDLQLAFTARRLRRLSEMMVEDIAIWLRPQVTAPARSASTIGLLAAEGSASITEIATRIGLSHPFVVRIVAQLERSHLVTTTPDQTDRRRRIVSLTPAGQSEAARIAATHAPVAAAMRELFADAGVDLPAALEAVEAALHARSLHQRLNNPKGVTI